MEMEKIMEETTMEEKRKLSEPLDYKTLPEFAREVEETLKKSVVAQDRAVKEVVKKFISSVFSDPERPKSVFFFAGPTGVGKTELVKAFAEYFLGSKEALVRIDCNTLKNEHDGWRLIGSPPGYVGSRERNRLFDQRKVDKWGFFKKIREELEKNPEKKKAALKKYTGRLQEKLNFLEQERERLKVKLMNLEIQKDNLERFGQFGERDKKNYTAIKTALNNKIAENKKLAEKIKKYLLELEKDNSRLVYLMRKDYEALQKKISLLREARMSDSDALLKDEEELEEFESYFDYKPGSYEAIILFDEFEKAHPALYDPILSIIDEGRLALSDNTVVEFKNAFIFFTSNIGSEQIKKILTGANLGFTCGVSSDLIDRQIYESTISEIDKFFLNRPEILGRIGKENIIVFRPLNKSELMLILENCTIPNFQKIAKEKMNINLIVEESFKKKIIDEASDKFNRPLGARPLLRIVKNKLEEPLCVLFHKNLIGSGDVVLVDWEEKNGKGEIGEIVFKKLIKEEDANAGLA